MVCVNRIGWRERSRRLLLFVTDAYSHLAGNGRVKSKLIFFQALNTNGESFRYRGLQLGGVIAPNDGKCHLNSTGMYVEATNQDYPSVGQISRLAKDNAINLIFAVTKEVVPAYQQFTEFISGSSVGVLDQDSANIVDLIRETYEVNRNFVYFKNRIHWIFNFSENCLDSRDERYSDWRGEVALLYCL